MADGGGSNKSVSSPALADAVQAHLGRASKFGGTPITRDWALYAFFRIHPQREFDNNLDRIKKVAAAAADTEAKKAAVTALVGAIAHAACANAGVGLEDI